VTTVISIIVLLLIYRLVYWPTIGALDRDIKQARCLMLLFPDEVCAAIPAIMNAAMPGGDAASTAMANTTPKAQTSPGASQQGRAGDRDRFDSSV
jgi:hypothetical protein